MSDAEGRISDSVEYKCVTTARDYLSATHVFRLGDNWFWLLSAAITLMCVYGGYTAIASLLDGGYSFKHLFWLAIFVGLYFGWFWVAFRLPERGFRDLPYIDVEFDMTVNEEGVFGCGERMKYGFYWGAYTKAVEKPDLFVLIQGRRAYQPFPKRCMTGEDITRIRALIREHIHEARLLN